MKNAGSYARKLSPFLKKLLKAHRHEPTDPPEPVTQFVLSFLQWNATTRLAQEAYARVMAVMVDHNDLRVSHPHEVVNFLGPGYPRAEERVARLLDALREIFIREHNVTLAHLSARSKKEAREYLDSLPGIPAYVVAQVMLLCFGAHATPVDDHLAQLLRRAEVVHPEASVEEIASFVEHHVKSEDALAVHHALRRWADARFKPDAEKPHEAKTAKNVKAVKPRKK